MRSKQTHDVPARLAVVGRRFERWRGTHRARSRIPNSLWTAAVKMAQGYGIHRTARTLRINYYALKKRVEEASAASPDTSQRVAATTFLELAPPVNYGLARVPDGPCECTLELEDTLGAKMRVHLKGIEAPDLAALSRSFWNPAS
jgi:hypothetical protein